MTQLQAYATPDDVKDLSLLDQFFTSNLAPDAKAILKACIAASSVADGYLAANPNITLPLSPPYDPALVQAVCDVVAYRLVAKRGYDPNTEDASLRERFDDAIKWFGKVQENRIVLVRQATKVQPQGPQPQMFSNPPRGLRNWTGGIGGFGR